MSFLKKNHFFSWRFIFPCNFNDLNICRRVAKFKKLTLKALVGTSLLVQWLRLHISNARGPGSIPGEGTRLHMPQLRVCMPQRRSKIQRATTKTGHSQINKFSSAGKESTCNVGDPGSIPGSGRSTGEGIGYLLQYSWAFLVTQLVKNLPAVQEARVQTPGWEDPLEKGVATHSSILARRISWTV